MKAKTIISGLILIAHIGFSIWYAQLSYSFKMLHENEMIAAFCGTAFILPALNNLLIHCEDTAYQVGIYHSHNLFALLLGTVFALHYTGYLITTNSQQIFIFCTAFLIIFITIFVNVMRYGLYKK